MEFLDKVTIERLRAATGNKFKSIISLFIINAEENLSELENSVKAGNSDVALRTAHSLWSATRQLGAARLSENMKFIEGRAKEKKLEDIKGCMSQIRAEFASIRRALDKLA